MSSSVQLSWYAVNATHETTLGVRRISDCAAEVANGARPTRPGYRQRLPVGAATSSGVLVAAR